MKQIRPKHFILILMLLILGACQDNPERHLKLGHWYSQKGLIDEAILEYKEVTRLYPDDIGDLSREAYETLAAAHYGLAIMYSKKEWWDFALQEAETCFQLLPTKEHYDLLELIKKRQSLEEVAASSGL